MSWWNTRRLSLLGTSAIWAAAIAVVSAVVLFALGAPTGSSSVLATIGSVLAGPGLLLAYMLQTGSGPEGASYPTDLAPHLLNFLFWWVITALALGWSRRHRYP
jgi:hypothetical protein